MGREARLPRSLLGIALVLAGIGAVLMAASPGSPSSVDPLGRNLPVNAGAGDPLDLSANNSVPSGQARRRGQA